MAEKTRQKSKSSKRPDNRPARARYWSSKRLRKKKIANLVRHNGFETEAAAIAHWLSVRQRYAG